MYIDDVYSSLLGSNFALLDLERVEILRGPQGTLAGKNSIGGSIKLSSKKPTGDNDGFAESRTVSTSVPMYARAALTGVGAPVDVAPGVGLAPNLYAFTFEGDDPVNATTKAAFVHTVWHLTDAMNLTAGYRYTEEDKDYTFIRVFPGTDIPHPFFGSGPDNVNGKKSIFADERSDFRLGVDYRWTDDFMTYVQYSTGYKGGGISPRPYFSSQAVPFGPEELEAFEVGAKSSLFDNRVRLNGAVFFNKYTDIQLGVQTCPDITPNNAPGPCAAVVGGADADVKGAELETEILVIDRLSIDASASYIDFEYTKILPTVAGVTKDMVTPFTPEWKFSAGIQYEAPLGDVGSLTPRLDAAYTDEVYAAALNNERSLVKSYTIANARLTWRPQNEDWQTALEVTNLFDKYYYRNKFDVSSSAGAVSATVGAPRMWAVSLKRNFQ